MQMLKKIFKSDSKYYLELDELKESKPVQAVVDTAEKVADVVQDKATEILESKPAQQAAETVEKTKDAAQEKLKSATKTEAKSGNQTSKKGAEESKKQPEAKAQPSPKAGASSFEPPFWVAAMYKNSSSNANSNGAQAGQTFATDNLMPAVTKYRRRPGPSLGKFKDMARQAKTPKG